MQIVPPKSKTIPRNASVFFLALALTAAPVFANPNPQRQQQVTKPKKKVELIHQDRIVSVSGSSISISHQSIDHKASTDSKTPVYKEVVRTYQITPHTSIELEGKQSKPEDLKPGMAATVSSSSPVSADGQGGDATQIVAHAAKPIESKDAAAKK